MFRLHLGPLQTARAAPPTLRVMTASEYIHIVSAQAALLSIHTRRVLALSSLLQTPKTNHKELQDFKARVAHDQKQLKALLEQRMWQA